MVTFTVLAFYHMSLFRQGCGVGGKIPDSDSAQKPPTLCDSNSATLLWPCGLYLYHTRACFGLAGYTCTIREPALALRAILVPYVSGRNWLRGLKLVRWLRLISALWY